VLKDNANVEVLGRPAMSVLMIGTLSRCPSSFLGRGGLFYCRRAWQGPDGLVFVNGTVLQLIRVLLLCVLESQLKSYIWLKWMLTFVGYTVPGMATYSSSECIKLAKLKPCPS
jgi:hypothetical protein